MIVLLCGFMGSGKSNIGRHLSHRLKQYAFIDTDDLIFERYGQGTLDIGEFIQREGFQVFRQYEFKVLKEIIDCKKNMIVALGGGLLRKETIALILKKNRILTVWVRASLDLCLKRIKHDTTRPLGKLPLKKMKTLYKTRSFYYKKADIIVDVSQHISVNDIINIISKKLEEHLSFEL